MVHSCYRLQKGFSLLELLIVIALIAGLLALSLTSVSVFTRKAHIQKAEAQIQVLQTGLEVYKREVGVLPQNSLSQSENGAAILYQALSGNGDDKIGGDRASLANPTRKDLVGKMILPELLPGNDEQQSWVSNSSSTEIIVVDPWGAPWHYVSGSPSEQNNTEYDLWSKGHEGGNDESKWITNWR